MVEKLLNAIHMLSHGIDSISLYSKRDYRKNIPVNAGEASNQRWLDIGQRLYNAVDKVVKQSG